MRRLPRALCLPLALLAACGGEPEHSEDASVTVGLSSNALVASPIDATHDTTLRSVTPYGNDGPGLGLGVSSASVAGLERALLRFETADMQSAVAGQTLHKATVKLTIASWQVEWLGGQIEILPMVTSWDEGTGLGTWWNPGEGPSWVCRKDTNTSLVGNFWNDCGGGDDWGMLPTDPHGMPFATTATDIAPVFTGGLSTVEFDVTSDVAQYLAGAANNGWILRGTNTFTSGELVQFASSESANPPELIIEYGPDECPHDPLKGVPGVCDCGNPDIDINGDRVADCIGPVVEPEADTTVRLVSPFANDGTGALLGVTSTSIVGLERSMVRFNQAAIAAAAGGQAVESAELRMTVAGIPLGWGGGTLAVHSMNRDWPEGNGLAGHGPSWVCRDDQNTTLPWLLIDNCNPGDEWAMSFRPGVPYPFDAVPEDTVPAFTTDRTITFDVTSDVQSFLAGTKTNHGWLIKGDDALLAGEWINFGSRESGTPPRLVLKLTPNCPADPNKNAPGVCGCGVADTDWDIDGVPDCIDECARDDQKSEAGICGCFESELDSDDDGVPDCKDECPDDAGQTRAGDCGCPSNPRPAGESCSDGICAGCFQCDGAGVCGDPEDCSPDPGNCTSLEFGDSTYWFCGADDWLDAANACNSEGGSLVRIDSAAENTLIQNVIGSQAWIGGNDRTTDGAWLWTNSNGTDGEQFWSGHVNGNPTNFLYSNWMTLTQPTGFDSCVSIDPVTGQWSGHACGANELYVCEMPGAELIAVPPCLEPENRCKYNPALKTCPYRIDPPADDCIELGDLNTQLAELQACEAACNGLAGVALDQCTAANCTGAATPPGPNDTCAAFTDEEANNCRLQALAGSVCGVPDKCGPCTSNADCDGAGGFVCGVYYPDDCTYEHCDDQGNCTDAGRTCRGVRRCGLPVDGCVAAAEIGYCTETEFCPWMTATADEVRPDGDIFDDDYDPAFKPDEQFDQPFAGPSSPEYDVACEDPGGGGCAPTGGDTGHAWCRYDVESDLPSESMDDVKENTSDDDGGIISFEFTPDLHMTYDSTAGPLGLSRFDVSTGAGFYAAVSLDLPAPGGGTLFGTTFDLLDANLGAAATHCGITTNGELTIMGENFLPVALDYLDDNFGTGVRGYPGNPPNTGVLPEFPFSLPETATQDECEAYFVKLEDAVHRAKKAFKDAQHLIKNYKATVAAGMHYEPEEFCEATKAEFGPMGFDSVVDCGDPSVTVHSVIQRYIDYYQTEALDRVRRAIANFSSESTQAPDFDGEDRFRIECDESPDEWKVRESELLASIQFPVGPVPMLLEVEAFVGYGIEAGITVGYDMSGILELAASTNSPDKEVSAEIGFVGADVTPMASAGITMFLGVGFSVPGIAGVSAGVEGQLTLADISLPIHGRAGIQISSEPSSRGIPEKIADVADSEPTMAIHPKAYRFGVTYRVGAEIRTENILSGRIAARVRISVLFFSKTWRVNILDFPGFCSYDGTGAHPEGCTFTIIDEGGTLAPNPLESPWGLIEMPMPFVNIGPLLPVSMPGGGPVEVPPSSLPGGGQLFYGEECSCVPGAAPGLPPALPADTLAEDRCWQNSECCNAGYVCFPDPANNDLRDCVECRGSGHFTQATPPVLVLGQSCNRDSDCCAGSVCYDGGEFLEGTQTLAGATCRPPRFCGTTCDENSDCATGACIQCTGAAAGEYPCDGMSSSDKVCFKDAADLTEPCTDTQ